MRILLQYEGRWLQFCNPVEELTATTFEEARDVLARIGSSEHWAAGWIVYEAAGAWDAALQTHPPDGQPLLCFGLYDRAEEVAGPADGDPVGQGSPPYELGEWTASASRERYAEAIEEIRRRIARGETYQVNYTIRLQAPFRGDSRALFADMTRAQPGGYGAYIEKEGIIVCCASPELFFSLRDGVITSKPMKGTRARGLTAEADRQAAVSLRESAKERAENIMITDMIRNDIGRIAVPGSVDTLRRFDVEGYPTVWQMTSTVQGRIAQSGLGRAAVGQAIQALFPCASITGAPKVKTMQIIRELEPGPRGIYTGSIGVIAPDGNAQFNVAIRTAVIDRVAGHVSYGTGGGIVWDSRADEEYDEALQKACILTRPFPVFQCLETMRYDPGKGIFLLDRHLRRLAATAGRFGFPVDLHALRDRLEALSSIRPMRIRLLLDATGGIDVQTAALEEGRDAIVALARAPVDSSNLFLYHKTTHREAYEQAVAGCPGADDVILYNERGELTESCTANLVLRIGGRWITPPLECGLLAGVFREELMERGEIEEGILRSADLDRADEIWLINSVRLWRRARK